MGCLVYRAGKCIVDDADQPVFFCKLGSGFDIRDSQQWIGWGFYVDQPCIIPDQVLKGLYLIVFRNIIFDAEALEFSANKMKGASVKAGLEYGMIPFLQKCQQGRSNGRHAGTEHHSFLSLFQGGNFFSQGL
ncbi:hypothetical protein ES708_17390 [subsurface metagenome]